MRTAPTKIALLAVASSALAVLAAVGWQLSRSTADSDVRAAAPDAPAPSAPAQVERESLAPLVLAKANTSAPNASPLAPDAQRVEVTDDLLGMEHLATVTLKGRIDSSRKDLGLAQVDVWPLWTASGIHQARQGRRTFNSPAWYELSPLDRHQTMQPQQDGSFEFDVTDLIQDRKRGGIAVELVVTVTHPMLTSATESVVLPDEERVRRERHIELTTMLHMPWGSATFRGEVRTIDGAAAAIQVAAFQTYDHEELVNVADAVFGVAINSAGNVPDVVVDRDFKMRVHPDIEYAIVAFAAGYRPCTLRATAKEDEEVTLPMLVLERGQRLAGQLLLGSADSVDGAIVSLQLAGEFTDVEGGGDTMLAWCGDVFEWGSRSVRVGGDRNYEFGGLGARAYKLSLTSVPGGYCDNLTSIEVVAPDSHADIPTGTACEVQLTFLNAGQPAVVYFGLQQERSGRMQHVASPHSDADGRVTLFIKPGMRTNIGFMDHHGERNLAIPSIKGGVVEMRIDL